MVLLPSDSPISPLKKFTLYAAVDDWNQVVEEK